MTPKIDGRLDDEVWKLAEASGDFYQREPDYGRRSSEKTEFRILYDERKIYFGVWLWDSQASRIIASEMKRDSGLNRGDQLKIIIDTFHDHRNGFYFSTNPLGALKDANTVENGRTINYDWNIVWENETSIDDKGWYVELAIPLSQLRFATADGETTWGLNLCRIILRKNEEAYWVPFPREWNANGFARLSNAGIISGLRGIGARRRLELLPYVSPRAARDYGSAALPIDRAADIDTNLGFDFKVGVTADLTADLTYKTDFAQVEADQEVVNLTRFSLFFPEKRQFFTESLGIFDYGKSASSPGGDAAAADPGHPAAVLQPAHRPGRRTGGADHRRRQADRPERTVFDRHHERDHRRSRRARRQRAAPDRARELHRATRQAKHPLEVVDWRHPAQS